MPESPFFFFGITQFQYYNGGMPEEGCNVQEERSVLSEIA